MGLRPDALRAPTPPHGAGGIERGATLFAGRLLFYVLYDAAWAAFEDPAQVINCCGRYGLSFAHAPQGAIWYAVLVDQRVAADLLALHGAPQWSVTDHCDLPLATSIG